MMMMMMMMLMTRMTTMTMMTTRTTTATVVVLVAVILVKKKRKRKKRMMTTSVGPNERRVRETLYHFRRPGHTFGNQRPCPAAVNTRKIVLLFFKLSEIISDDY